MQAVEDLFTLPHWCTSDLPTGQADMPAIRRRRSAHANGMDAAAAQEFIDRISKAAQEYVTARSNEATGSTEAGKKEQEAVMQQEFGTPFFGQFTQFQIREDVLQQCSVLQPDPQFEWGL